MIEAGFKYFMQNKLYIWKKKKVENSSKKIAVGEEEKIMSPETLRLSGSKLRDLAWSLDVLDLSKEKQSR